MGDAERSREQEPSVDVSLDKGGAEESRGGQSETSEDHEEQLSPLLDAPDGESPHGMRSEEGGEEEEREIDEEESAPEDDECEPATKRVCFRGSILVQHASSVNITVHVSSQNRGLKRALKDETEDHGTQDSTKPDTRAWLHIPKKQIPSVPQLAVGDLSAHEQPV